MSTQINNSRCAICQEDFDSNNRFPLRLGCCAAQFHPSCITTSKDFWSTKCPNCRQESDFLNKIMSKERQLSRDVEDAQESELKALRESTALKEALVEKNHALIEKEEKITKMIHERCDQDRKITKMIHERCDKEKKITKMIRERCDNDKKIVELEKQNLDLKKSVVKKSKELLKQEEKALKKNEELLDQEQKFFDIKEENVALKRKIEQIEEKSNGESAEENPRKKRKNFPCFLSERETSPPYPESTVVNLGELTFRDAEWDITDFFEKEDIVVQCREYLKKICNSNTPLKLYFEKNVWNSLKAYHEDLRHLKCPCCSKQISCIYTNSFTEDRD